jgi:hypothetical protein
MSRGCHDLDERPAVPNRSSKLETVHTARHLDICEYHGDVRANFECCNGLVRAPRFDDFKRLLDHFDGVHPDYRRIFAPDGERLGNTSTAAPKAMRWGRVATQL